VTEDQGWYLLAIAAFSSGVLFFMSHKGGGLFALALAFSLAGAGLEVQAQCVPNVDPYADRYILRGIVGPHAGQQAYALYDGVNQQGYPVWESFADIKRAATVDPAVFEVNIQIGGTLYAVMQESVPGEVCGTYDHPLYSWQYIVEKGPVRSFTVRNTLNGEETTHYEDESWPDGTYQYVPGTEECPTCDYYNFTPFNPAPPLGQPIVLPAPPIIPPTPPLPPVFDPSAPILDIDFPASDVTLNADFGPTERYLQEIRDEIRSNKETIDQRLSDEFTANRDEIDTTGQQIVNAIDSLRDESQTVQSSPIDPVALAALESISEGVNGPAVDTGALVDGSEYGGSVVGDLEADSPQLSENGVLFIEEYEELVGTQSTFVGKVVEKWSWAASLSPVIGTRDTYTVPFGVLPMGLGDMTVTADLSSVGARDIVRAFMAWIVAIGGMFAICKEIRDGQI
tara:strand:+ start:3321 stop:4682 length:1362 start_codon:yes stop_codon:yes gene_type:complete